MKGLVPRVTVTKYEVNPYALFLKILNYQITQNDAKANVTERTMKTLKNMLHRYFSREKTFDLEKQQPQGQGQKLPSKSRELVTIELHTELQVCIYSQFRDFADKFDLNFQGH